MNIRLDNVQFTEINCKVTTFNKEVTKSRKMETEMKVGTLFADPPQNGFAIVFQISLKEESEEFILILKAIAHYHTDSPIDEDFKKSDFLEISAPAIAYPYIRTFISNLTLNSGFDPIIMPTINFVKLAHDKRKD